MPVRHDGPRGDDGARSKGAGACIACRAEQAVATLARLTAPRGAVVAAVDPGGAGCLAQGRRPAGDVLHDPPYGSERCYNGLRLADNLLKQRDDLHLTVFLMADAVACAKSGQQTPDGFYNLERMLKPVVRRGQVLLCGSCMEARGLRSEELLEGCRRSSLDELTTLTLEADKTLVF
jgi:uncharacterized protein involved in oxidation of intracellular sulfur